MTLDKDTLTQAEQARDRLLDLQHSAEVARVDYHHTIRRLHAAGGSLREIADALGLSHQRVHQIVEPVDGSSGRGRGRPGYEVRRVHRRLRGFVPFERFTQEARDVVASAIDESAALGHRRVGTEHLLISLTGRGSESTVGAALTRARRDPRRGCRRGHRAGWHRPGRFAGQAAVHPGGPAGAGPRAQAGQGRPRRGDRRGAHPPRPRGRRGRRRGDPLAVSARRRTGFGRRLPPA